MSSQNKLIVALVVVLLLVVVLSVAAIMLFSPVTDTGLAIPDPAASTVPLFAASSPSNPAAESNVVLASPAAPASGASDRFNLNVFMFQTYRGLNTKYVQDGSLPVPPPAVIGKVNPFL